MTDIIADALTRIRNALKVKKPEVILVYSKLVFSLGKILEDKRLITKIEKIKSKKLKNKKSFDQIKVILKYDKDGQPAIKKLQRISKPGRRVYLKSKQIKPVLAGRGLLIISSPTGLITDQQAREKRLGGEIICEIY